MQPSRKANRCVQNAVVEPDLDVWSELENMVPVSKWNEELEAWLIQDCFWESGAKIGNIMGKVVRCMTKAECGAQWVCGLELLVDNVVWCGGPYYCAF